MTIKQTLGKLQHNHENLAFAILAVIGMIIFFAPIFGAFMYYCGGEVANLHMIPDELNGGGMMVLMAVVMPCVLAGLTIMWCTFMANCEAEYLKLNK